MFKLDEKHWVGKLQIPKWYCEAYEYGWYYIRGINKPLETINKDYKKRGIGNLYQLRTLNVVFWMDCDLSERGALGIYIANGIVLDRSPSGLIKIDIRAHNNFEEIKHTIRHEITHAIAHQIDGSTHNSHNNRWIQIAREHNVNVDKYL